MTQLKSTEAKYSIKLGNLQMIFQSVLQGTGC